jgi:hypothetical protein
MFEFGPVFDVSQKRPKVAESHDDGPATSAADLRNAGKEEMERFYVSSEAGKAILAYAADVQAGAYLQSNCDNDSLLPSYDHASPCPAFEQEALLSYMTKCPMSYVAGIKPRRFLRHAELVHSVSGTENIEVNVEEAFLTDASDHYWVDIAAPNSMPQKALENAAHLLYLHNFDIGTT